MSPKIRYVLFIDGACNLVVLVAKATVGFKTGSLAILGDAIHSLADVANNVVALVVVRIASEPPDREHPYGHQKFETLAVFGLAMLLAVLAIEIVIRAIDRSGREVVQTGWGLAVMLGVLVVNMGPCTLGASLGSQTRLSNPERGRATHIRRRADDCRRHHGLAIRRSGLSVARHGVCAACGDARHVSRLWAVSPGHPRSRR